MATTKPVKGYWSTKDLCKRFCCSSRTITRWREREDNPLPKPRLTAIGSQNRWAIDDIEAWEQALDPTEENQELSGNAA